MIVKEFLRQKIFEVSQKIYPEVITTKEDINIDYPEKSFGDYSTTVAFKMLKDAKKLGKNLKLSEIAQNIKSEVEPNIKEIFEDITIANGGFLNFRLSKTFLEKKIEEISKDENYGVSEFGKDKGKILLEYVSANPTGPLHIGHARWAAIGDSLYRAFKTSGYDITTEFYINDAGNQINLLLESVKAVKEGREIPENGYHGYYIQE
ncbi:MAG: arginine--tRNA ligase, partial [Brevinematia bacterium]